MSVPGPLCTTRVGLDWLDLDTSCLTRSPLPGPLGVGAASPLPSNAPAAAELSGVQWVARFPTSSDVADLVEPFRGNVQSFLGAIAAAGGTTRVSATLRPPERAYLMHYASKLARGEITAAGIPSHAGVDINWVHPTEAASVEAARAMAAAYGIVFPPALHSRHSEGRAIDMTITDVIGKSVADADGSATAIRRLSDLHAVGASYGVIKLASDPPHWSDDGH